MQRVRLASIVLVLGLGALAVSGCRGEESFCPAPNVTVDPAEIPEGDNDTLVTVNVSNPNPDNGREVLTRLNGDEI